MAANAPSSDAGLAAGRPSAAEKFDPGTNPELNSSQMLYLMQTPTRSPAVQRSRLHVSGGFPAHAASAPISATMLPLMTDDLGEIWRYEDEAEPVLQQSDTHPERPAMQDISNLSVNTDPLGAETDTARKLLASFSLGKRPPPSPAVIRPGIVQPNHTPVRVATKRQSNILTPAAFKFPGASVASAAADPSSQTAAQLKQLQDSSQSFPVPKSLTDLSGPPCQPVGYQRTEKRRTLLVYPQECLDHHTGVHQESRRRLGVLCGPGGILRSRRFQDLAWLDAAEIRKATIGDILRVHDHDYVQHVKKLCQSLPLQEDKGRDRCPDLDLPPSGSLDLDTMLSSKSFDAALTAVGAVCTAVDHVVKGKYRNAFVAVRPPGHHSGPKGAVAACNFSKRPEMCSSGFCLLNNVAIAAAYAKVTYRRHYDTPAGAPLETPVIDRIAIVDFDIHHGNGTEEIIRNLRPRKQRLPLPASWAPMEYESYKPWLDEDDGEKVLFASVHLYNGDGFYPCSGSESESEHGPDFKILNIPLEPLGAESVAARTKLSAGQRKEFQRRASFQFRSKIENHLLPQLEAFAPDLILISAGFDGHSDDFYYYLMEEDYSWVTTKLQEVADKHSLGRLVSVLEGGYSLLPKDKPKIKKKSSRNKLASQEEEEVPFSLPLSCEDPNYIYAYGGLARSCAEHVAALMS